MHDRTRLVPGEDFLEPRGITNVSVFEWAPSNRPLVTLLKRIVTDRREPRFGKRLADVAADKARAAGDQDNRAHESPPNILLNPDPATIPPRTKRAYSSEVPWIT